MDIVVLVKQIPDPEALVTVGGDGTSLTIEPKFAMNIFDAFAVEEALQIKALHTRGKVKVIALGNGKAMEVLRTGIAMGADEALLLDDEAFLDGDGYANAFVLSRAIAREHFDIILCGRQAIDDDRGEVGQMVAQFLGLPHIGGIVKLAVDEGRAVAEVAVEGGKETIETPLPALFTAEKGLNEPRVPLITGVMKAMRAPIARLTAADLGLAPEQTGRQGAKVKTLQYSLPKKKPAVQIIPGEPHEAAIEAVRILMEVEKLF